MLRSIRIIMLVRLVLSYMTGLTEETHDSKAPDEISAATRKDESLMTNQVENYR